MIIKSLVSIFIYQKKSPNIVWAFLILIFNELSFKKIV